jgi:hypothetical protein
MRWTLFVLIFLFLGCSSTPNTVATPSEVDLSNQFQISGNIIYNGDKDFLPQHLKEKSSASNIQLKYSYEAVSEAVNSLQAPMSTCSGGGCLYSMPSVSLGQNVVSVVGKLEIVQGGRVLKTYQAAARTVKDRNLWEDRDTVAQIEEESLIGIRDNIDAQLQSDKQLLQQILTGSQD